MKKHNLGPVSGVLLATALCALLTVPALSADVPEGTKLADTQTVAVTIMSALNALDPQLNEDVDTGNAINNLFEGLYNEDAKGDLVPALAESYTLSDDRTVYTFKLRKALWSNGDPITASDFVFGWRRAVDPATASPYAYYPGLAGIANADDIVAGKKKPEELGVKAIDDQTLEVTLSSPRPYFLKTTVVTTLFPVPQKVVEKFGKDWVKPENIVSNGAYVLKQNSPGELVVLTRNKNYWDDAKTVINELRFVTINEEAQEVARYAAGEVDVAGIPTGQLEKFQAEYPNDVHVSPKLCTYYFDLNVTASGNKALQDQRVREALYLALDRDTLINKVLKGAQIPAYFFTPEATSGFKAPDLPVRKMTQAERDAKAKELLAAAGYGPDNPLKFEYIYNTSEGHKKIAVVVSQMYKEKLGAEMTIRDMEWATLLDTRHQKNYEVSRDGWCGDYNEASTFLSLMDSKSTQNNTGYASKEVDDLLAASLVKDDPSADYAKIEEIIAHDLPIIPVYHYTSNALVKPNLKGWPFDNVEGKWYAKDMYKVAE